MRFDVPKFGDTGYPNANADALTFRDENGSRCSTPRANCRIRRSSGRRASAFNWDVTGDRNTQVRGGTGIFTGSPAYVWISNQIGNTGVLTGFEAAGQHDRPAVQPRTRTLQARRTSTGRSGGDVRAGADGPGLQVPAGVAQQRRASTGSCPGAGRDGRVHLQPRRQRHLLHQRQPAGRPVGVRRRRQPAALGWRLHAPTAATASTGSTRHGQLPIVMKNQNVGRSWNIAATLVRRPSARASVKGAYSYGDAKNTVDPGIIASVRGPATTLAAIRTTPASATPPRRRDTGSSCRQATARSTSSSARPRCRLFWEAAPTATPATLFAAT